MVKVYLVTTYSKNVFQFAKIHVFIKIFKSQMGEMLLYLLNQYVKCLQL